MTDRHSGYVVVLDKDIRDDDSEDLLKAIRLIRGVISVKPIEGGVDKLIAGERARHEIWEKIRKAIDGD